MAGLRNLPESVFDAWSALWEGAAAVHDRHVRIAVTRRIDWGDPWIEWRIRERGAPRPG